MTLRIGHSRKGETTESKRSLWHEVLTVWEAMCAWKQVYRGLYFPLGFALNLKLVGLRNIF